MPSRLPDFGYRDPRREENIPFMNKNASSTPNRIQSVPHKYADYFLTEKPFQLMHRLVSSIVFPWVTTGR